MLKRSLTLLETLIAIVLILAMSALVIPSLLSSMEERTFESAADVTNDHLMMARAHAQATGSPVEVMFSADRSQVFARFFRAGGGGEQFQLSTTPGAEDNDVRNLGPLAPESDEFAGSDQTLIAEPWAVRDISRDIRIMNHRPIGLVSSDSVSEPDLSSKESEVEETLESLGSGQEVRLAVFMPDGSALLGEPVWLDDDKGRVGMLTINPWSGIPLFQRLVENDVVAGARGAQDDPSRAHNREGASKDGKSGREDRDRSSSRQPSHLNQDDDSIAPWRSREPDFGEE